MVKRSDYYSWVGVTALVGMVGCASPPPAPPPVDLDAARQELMDADRAWSETGTDVDEFITYFADDPVFLPFEAPRIDGVEAIHEFVTGLTQMPGFSLSWEATSAHVSEDATLGYSLGTFEMTLDDAEGNPTSIEGKYLTVWQKQADGQWKVTADTFNEDAPPSATVEP